MKFRIVVASLSLALTGGLLMSSAPHAQVAQPEPAFFSGRVFPILQEAKCSGCHSSGGVASGTRLHFPEKDAAEGRIQAFGLSLAHLIDRSDFSKSLLLTKPTNVIRHAGGLRIKPGSDDEKILSQWVQYLSSASDEALAAARNRLTDTADAAPTQLVRRLTHSQYDNTVRDLLSDYSRPAERFPPEDYADGFKNQLTSQGMPPLLVETYSTSAEKLALNAFRIGDINGLIPCKPASVNDQKCRDEFVRQFGRRAFRRPLSDDEVQRYAAVFSAQARASRKFLVGAQVVVEAMLQSPNFLFHVEAGPDGRFTDYDVASRLSYLLWNTMPDNALFEAAANGELRTVEGRQQAARRMIQDARARQALDQFFEEWMRFDRVINAVKQRNRFPDFSPDLMAAMVEETRTLLHHLVWNDRNFMEALTADYSFLSAELASLYKLPAPPGQFEMVKFPADSPRAGLLGQGAFLVSTAGPQDTSPTARGIFIRERLLCQHVPPPPPGVLTTLPEPLADVPPKTRRQLMNEHVTNPTCASCHRLMDPIGFGFENFDAIGRWRDEETVLVPSKDPGTRGARPPRPTPVNLPVVADGEIVGLTNSAFSDPKRIGQILAESPVCQECIVRQLFRYAYGRLETAADENTIDQIFARFKESGFRFKQLMIAIVESPEFLRKWDNVPTRNPGARSTGSARRQ
jgi:Protein of unknown function (DUF1592)/Protein of unknown function (DUF1588)/Protein of unknown function (DUF1595)/Protein of unknown function (DUF1585)/Protein of unknown function (DUF1587)